MKTRVFLKENERILALVIKKDVVFFTCEDANPPVEGKHEEALRAFASLYQSLHLKVIVFVHIAVVEVFACHAPDEHIVGRAGCGMD